MQKQDELVAVLEGIRDIRHLWLTTLDDKIEECRENFPTMNDRQVKSMALGSKEVQELHMRLLNLYSIIGQDAQGYIDTLVEETNVIPLLRVA